MSSPSVSDLAQITDPRARAQAIGRLLAEHQASLMDLARLRREAVAELRSAGLTQAQVAQVLGVTPGRVAQLEPETAGRPPVLVERGIPTDPGVRASRSLFLSETADQGVTPTRRMLYVGQEPAPAHIANRLGIAAGEPVLVRRKLMSANGVPLRISASYFPVSLSEGLTDPDF
ncbi:MAG: UTRA domain-containing protein, partial [Pseudonocardiaceae bacterium]